MRDTTRTARWRVSIAQNSALASVMSTPKMTGTLSVRSSARRSIPKPRLRGRNLPRGKFVPYCRNPNPRAMNDAANTITTTIMAWIQLRVAYRPARETSGVWPRASVRRQPMNATMGRISRAKMRRKSPILKKNRLDCR